MAILLLIFGLFSGCLLSVLVGFIGRGRNIGFGWSFLISIIFTPVVGLIVTLLFEKKQPYVNKSWGCLGVILGVITAIVLILACTLVTMLFSL